jgi:DNA polymerase-3 subunit epsilon
MRRARSQSAAAYRRARLPGRRTPWREASWCAVDLELSGLDPDAHEIISFGAIPVEQGRVQLHHAVTGMVCPEKALTESSILVHGCGRSTSRMRRRSTTRSARCSRR